MPKLSKETALSAIAQEVKQGQPTLVDLLKESGLANPMDTVQSLKLLSPEQANFLRLKFGKPPIEAPKEKPQGFAPKTPEKVTAPTKQPQTPEGLKTLEDLSTEWGVKLSDMGRILNITKLSYGVEFKGYVDANWEYLLGSVRSLLAPEYGGTGAKSPEQAIGEIQAQLKVHESDIDAAGVEATAADDSFAVDVLGNYLGAVNDENDLEHDAVIDSFTSSVAAQLRQKYDSDRIKRIGVMKFALDLDADAQRRHERNAAQASLGWQERVKQLAGTAQRVTNIALAPVRSDKRNAASIVAAIAASNRP
jgi:hypothetical protein